MAIMDATNGDPDVMRIWSLLTEVSEQLTQNRTLSVSLHPLVCGIKTQAIHSQSGFVLRRFNLDKPKDAYDAELERMNAAMTSENQTLQNDNRQLNALIREYEQTLENVMSSFRTRAYEVQQHELAVMREYESAIIQRETEALEAALIANNARSESLARIGRLLRAVMRKLSGEDVKAYEGLLSDEGSSVSVSAELSTSGSSSSAANDPTGSLEEIGRDAQKEGQINDDYVELARELDDEEESENLQKRLASAEWALERESELARLERENEELRTLLNGVLNADTSAAAPVSVMSRPDFGRGDYGESGRVSPAHSIASTSSSATVRGPPRRLGGPPGTVGPFGTFKMRSGS